MAFVTKDVIIGNDIIAPAGHSQSTSETPLTSQQILEKPALTIAASGVVAATAVAGFDALFTAIESAVDTYIGTTLGVDTASNSVDYNAIVTVIELPAVTDIYLNDANRDYLVSVTVKVRIY